MADFSPTKEQFDAITARGASLLISAGAGSGKTRVLTERLISYLTDESTDCNISDFLIITYTRAAAAELRVRILSAISDELVKNPKNRRLRRQMILVHSAQIDTIHSFCGRIVRENAHRLGISPDFRIAEESECESVKSAVMSKLLDSRYENISSFEGFEQLVNTLSPGRDDSRLIETALDMYEKLRSHADSGRWIDEKLQQLNPNTGTDVITTPWGALLLEKARNTAEYWLETINILLDESGEDPEIIKAYGECFSSVAAQLVVFLESCKISWDNARAASEIFFPRAKSLRGDEYENIKAAWKSCKADIGGLADIFVGSSEELIADMIEVYPTTKALFMLVTDFSDLYLTEKRRRHIVDFSDLEHFALALLEDTDGVTALAGEISSRYREIMIDEYQDVSAIQERIFSAISKRGKNLVMVGDVRQSIYRFRLAEPSIFLSKYKSYSDDPDDPARRIILSDNFRSNSKVLDAVNYVFHGIMSEQFGEMDYTDREYLRAGRSDTESGEPVEFRIITPENIDGEAPERRVLEAQYVARRAKTLVESGFLVPDGNGMRPLKYSDIAVLIRSRTYAGLFRDALNNLGVPVETDEADSLLDAYEVRLALAFLYIVDNPHNDIQLISVLRVYGFSPDELAEARLCSQDGDFYDALTLYAEKSEKAKLFFGQLHEFRTLAPELLADGLLWHIYNSTNLQPLMSELPNGSERLANLVQLTSEARIAAAFGYSGVFEFLRYLERMRTPIGCISAHSSGGVRIMSIHKSKGLEFPVVFLVDLSHRFNMQDTKKRFLFHPELGAGQKRIDLQRRIEYPTLPRLVIAEKIADESKAEELRVLYVAMTRAKEKLIMVYSDTNPDRTLEKLANPGYPVSPHLLNSQPSTGNILLLALLSRPESRALFGGDAPAGIFDMKIERLLSEDREKPIKEVPATEIIEPITKAPEFTYSYPMAPLLPSKLTVTELKSRIIDAVLIEDSENLHAKPLSVAFKKPNFITQRVQLTGAALGTVLHTAMKHIPMREYSSHYDLRCEIDTLSERGLMTDTECKAVNSHAILNFLSSNLGKRVILADELFREFKFSLLVPAEDFFPGGGSDEILFQGVIDLAFREGNTITIIDFKTDKLFSEASLAEKTELYRFQIESYMKALRRVTGLRIDEGYIYFFDNCISVRI